MILNNSQDLTNNTASQLIGLEISEAREKLGYWWVLENQHISSSGSQYYFSRAGIGKITLYTNEKNIVVQTPTSVINQNHEGVLSMGFFEDELRKIVGANSPITDARYGGRACVGRLGDTTNVKLQFVELGTHEQYEGIKAIVFNRNEGEIDSNVFRFADILGKNVTRSKHGFNSAAPYVWNYRDEGYDWYGYKLTTTDYATVANEVNAYLEIFLEQQRQPVKEKAKNLYLLYWQGEWGAESTAKLELITSDKKTLYAVIGSEVLAGNMKYLGESGGEGFAEYKKDYLAGVDVLKELNWGFVKQMPETLLSDLKTISEHHKSAHDFLAADFRFDPAEFDRANNSEDEEDKMTVFCECCISAVKSRGEKIFVGGMIHDEEYDTCGWCHEPNEELYEVKFEKYRTTNAVPRDEDVEDDMEV